MSARTLASRLNRRVVIEQPVLSADGAGGNSLSWSVLATVWAEVEPGEGSRGEQVVAAQLSDRPRAVVVMRYRDDVDATMRLKMDGVVWAIRSVQEREGRGVALRLNVERGSLGT
jgi:SPP1 family predicted phage head-tail adaptor